MTQSVVRGSPTPGVPDAPLSIEGTGALVGLPVAGSNGAAITPLAALAVALMIDGGNGSAIAFQGLPDGAAADNALPEDAFIRMGTIARLTALDQATGQFWRMRSAETGIDNIPNVPAALMTVSVGYLYRNNDIFGRARSADPANLETFSGEGAALSAGPGEWAIQAAPAAATQATASRASAGAGNRNVLRSVTVSVGAVAAQAPLGFVVRDGATGAGTIIWRCMLGAAAGGCQTVTVSGLNIVGSEATAMTVESLVAPAATNFATVAASGYIAFA